MTLKNGAKIALTDCLDVDNEEQVLIVTDTDKQDIGQAFFEEANRLDVEPLLTIMEPRKTSGEEPPPSVAASMQESEVVIAPTSKSLSHTQARKAACDAGSRVATLPGVTEQMMVSGGMQEDYSQLAKAAREITEFQLQGVKQVSLVSENGTEVTFDLSGRDWKMDTGICHESGCFTNLPGGEIYIAPRDAEGTLIVDGSLSTLGLVHEPVKIEIKDGRATDFSGPQSAELQELLDSAGPAGRNVAELGIGLNRSAQLIGKTLEDEKVAGTMHVAFGDNSTFGGDVEASIHLDGMITDKPKLLVNGEQLTLPHLDDQSI